MKLRRLPRLALIAASLAMAQTCENYGVFNSTSDACDCPPSLGGATCSSLACSNSILPPAFRPAASATTGCQSSCSDGFTGINCNVCTSSSACISAIAAYPDASARIASSTALGGNQSVTCNTSPYTYTQGFMDCAVINVALQSIYAGSTTLTIQKTVEPNLSLAFPFGSSGSALAQLYYAADASSAPVEQFYCQADSCTQTNTTAETTYSCADLKCTCRPGTAFCGGAAGGIDLSTTIDSMQGPLDIACSSADASSCSFKQSLLVKLFGEEGLGLSGCSQGECVREDVRLALAPNNVGSDSGSALAPGVIAGLAVIGGLVALLLGLVVLGFWRQRKAAKSHSSLQHGPKQVGVSWQNVSYALPGANFASLRRAGPAGKNILDGLSAGVPCGALVAILGPSGAGKSTFVDILAGKRKRGYVSGSVDFVPEHNHSSEGELLVAFVDQDDVLPPMSTVHEAMMFAAKLKLPESISIEAKSRRVAAVLEQLGLAEVANVRIGSPERRGISGGQRRRLSIGLELLAQPSVLILDEPTSGLDSVSAYRVVDLLRRLTQGALDDGHEESSLVRSRTTVIATLHQPSSRIFHCFDTVCLLANGRQVHFGPTADVQAHFARLGFPLAAESNIADHLLELASSEPSQLEAKAGSISEAHDEKLALSSSHSSSIVSPAAHPYLRSRHRPVTTYFTQYQVLASRESRNLVRDKSLLLSHVAVGCLLGLFIGGLYYQTDESIAGFQNRIGSLFFLGSLLAFSALSALANFTTARPLFIRERSARFYSAFVWLLCRISFDIVPLRILPTILLGTISYFMVGLSQSAATFFKFLLILVEYSVSVTLLNLLIAALIRNQSVAILLAAILDLFQMAYAGFFVNLSHIPPALRWLQWLCPLKYALEALAVNEVGSGLSIVDTLAGVKVQVSASLIMNTLFGFQDTAYYRDVCILVAWIALFAALVVLAVSKVMREYR